MGGTFSKPDNSYKEGIMSNVNSNGFYNLPAQFVTTTSETALLVPATGAAGLPSPLLPANSGLCVGWTDLLGNADGHPFTVFLACKAAIFSSNFNFKLYQIPAAVVGTIGRAGSVTSTGTLGAGAVSLGGPIQENPLSCHFFFTYTLMWDAVSGKLDGQVYWQLDGFPYLTPNNAIQVTGITSAKDLNFMPSFIFIGGANAGNSITITEFSINRL
jgi:hypothetical protein